jgi:predicted transglutaminase-like cysteine proteinase
VTDYWATPKEFLMLSGDCEDYSIAKYFALKQLGLDISKMRIVVVKDRIRNVGHAVLAVYMDNTAYILDNLSNLVLPHNKYSHYIPQYSVNEIYRWAHIRIGGN